LIATSINQFLLAVRGEGIFLQPRNNLMPTEQVLRRDPTEHIVKKKRVSKLSVSSGGYWIAYTENHISSQEKNL
jgi:hypothetical protein